LHATIREWVAIDVGEIVGDTVAWDPSILELGDFTGETLGELDRDTDVLLAELLSVTSLDELHACGLALCNGCIVDVVTAVVDDGGRANGHSRLGKGKQHGCASDGLGELHIC